jgi:hypothetical protein
VSERQASVHTGGPGRLARDRHRHRDQTLHLGTGVVGGSAPSFADASAPSFPGRTRKVTCARSVMDQHDLPVALRAGGGPGHSVAPGAGGGPGHDIGENS